MILLTKESDYALKALAFIAKQGQKAGNGLVTVEQVAQGEKIPKLMLRRVLQTLAREKVLHSQKGKKGGFSLIMKPDKVTIADIIKIFQGPIDLTNCTAANKKCSCIQDCKLRDNILEINETVKNQLDKITIASLT